MSDGGEFDGISLYDFFDLFVYTPCKVWVCEDCLELEGRRFQFETKENYERHLLEEHAEVVE